MSHLQPQAEQVVLLSAGPTAANALKLCWVWSPPGLLDSKAMVQLWPRVAQSS